MIIIYACLCQLLLITTCLGQISQDSPVLHVVPPVRAPLVPCYINSKTWTWDNTIGNVIFTAKDLDLKLCTHIIYDSVDQIPLDDVRIDDEEEENDGEEKIPAAVRFRNKDPNIKYLLSIGGDYAPESLFQRITANDSTTRQFAQDAIRALRKDKINGLDIAWKYPRGYNDRTALVSLLQELRQAFEDEAINTGQSRLLLTVAAHGYMGCAPEGYDVPEISKYADFINLITYSYFGALTTTGNGIPDGRVGHHGPLRVGEKASNYDKKLTVEHSVRNWIKEGAPKEKIMVGISTVARTWQLATPELFKIGSPSYYDGDPADYTKQLGIMSYYEVCKFLNKTNTAYEWDEVRQVPYAHNKKEWVGFEDERSVKAKVNWAKREGLGGISVYTVNMDDWRNFCGKGKFPLLNTIRKELEGYKVKLEYRGPYESTYHVNKDRVASDLAGSLVFTSTLENKSPQICSDDQFRCNNGECIDRNKRCDGKAHCSDSSDETYTVCKWIPCPRGYFRCKYGGCIQSNKKCDRALDCIDASDEDGTLCGNRTSPDGCVAPPSVPGTQYISGFCDPSDTSAICITKSGSVMTFGSHLHVRCSEKYALLPSVSKTLTCRTNEEYSPSPPTTCQRTCPPLVNFPNVEYECKMTEFVVNGRPYYKDIPCLHLPLIVGIKAKLSCPLQFEQQEKVSTCLSNGEWDKIPTMECEPLCGTRRSDLYQHIDDGSELTYPWHVGIYWYEGKEVGYEYVCGGSLLSQTVVLTAAHCGFSDEKPYPPSQMFVALGKQKLQSESDTTNKKIQKFSVKEFLFPPEHSGSDQSFRFDVGLIVLTSPVKFGDDVYPVCINYQPNRFQYYRASGQVPGWEESKSVANGEELQSAEIRYLPREECYDLLKNDPDSKILTDDKFCGGYVGKAGPKAMKGDSGEGLVFQENGLYYVVGIASTTFLENDFRIGAYTNVSTHSYWIKTKLAEHLSSK